MKERIANFLSYILPNYCHHCNDLIHNSSSPYYCIKCIQNLDKLIKPVRLYRKDLNQECSEFFSIVDYHELKKIMNLVSDIKTHNKSFLLHMLLSRLVDLSILPHSDEIVYIPLAFRKYLERGFNPSFIIAQYLSQQLEVPLYKKLTKKDTIAQSSYNRKDRLSNMSKPLFQVKNKKINFVKNYTILIVDDIITTGATLSNAAKTLKNIYPEDVRIIGFGLFHSEGG